MSSGRVFLEQQSPQGTGGRVGWSDASQRARMFPGTSSRRQNWIIRCTLARGPWFAAEERHAQCNPGNAVRRNLKSRRSHWALLPEHGEGKQGQFHLYPLGTEMPKRQCVPRVFTAS